MVVASAPIDATVAPAAIVLLAVAPVSTTAATAATATVVIAAAPPSAAPPSVAPPPITFLRLTSTLGGCQRPGSPLLLPMSVLRGLWPLVFLLSLLPPPRWVRWL